MKNKLIFANTSALPLARKVVRELDTKLGKVDLRKFTSGEICAELLDDVAGKEVFIIGTTGNNPNDDLMEILLLADAARRNFPAKVHAILPYYPYCRQDKKFETQSPISAALVARLLEATGIDSLYSITLHNRAIEGFFQVPVKHEWAHDLIVEYLQKKKIKKPVLVAPDKGAAKWVANLANDNGFDYAIINKIRPQQQRSKVLDIIGDVKNKTCIIIDDMVDTGSSVMPVKEALLKAGANQDVYVAVAHSVLSGEGFGNIVKARFKEYITTDTIPLDPGRKYKKIKVLSVAPMIARYIMEM